MIKYKNLLIVLAFVFAAINSSHLLEADYNTPVDFRNVYLGAKLWRSHQNPYIDSVLKYQWQGICEREHIDPIQPPGLPTNPLVYPPNALLLYTPFTLLSWKQAVWANIMLMLVSIGIIIYMCYQLFRHDTTHKIPLYVVLLIILAFKGTMHALLVGQPSFAVNALALSGLHFCLNKKRPILASILFACAAFKPTMLAPYMIFLIYKREWKTLFYTACFSTAIVTVSFLLVPDPAYFLQAALNNIKSIKELAFTADPVLLRSSLTELGVLLLVWINDYSYHSYIYVVIGIMFALYVYKSKTTRQAYIFCLCMLLSLLFSHHLYYDCLFLLPIIWVLPSYSLKIQLAISVFALTFFLPVNGILHYLKLLSTAPIFAATLPISLLCITILLLLNRPGEQPLSQDQLNP